MQTRIRRIHPKPWVHTVTVTFDASGHAYDAGGAAVRSCARSKSKPLASTPPLSRPSSLFVRRKRPSRRSTAIREVYTRIYYRGCDVGSRDPPVRKLVVSIHGCTNALEHVPGPAAPDEMFSLTICTIELLHCCSVHQGSILRCQTMRSSVTDAHIDQRGSCLRVVVLMPAAGGIHALADVQ